MDKNSLKKIIKPLIKECLTEILYEQGLNKLIEESIKRPTPRKIMNVPNNYPKEKQKFI
jgi:hypothetical protein